jgi:hypothetical protein
MGALAFICFGLGTLNYGIGGRCFWSVRWLGAKITGDDEFRFPPRSEVHYPFEFLWMWGSISFLIAAAALVVVHSVWSYIIYDRDEYDWIGRRRDRINK